MKRQPVVAGQFYAGNATQLRSDMAKLLPHHGRTLRSVTGIVAPHAGHIYSGSIAAKIFSVIDLPERILILGPNHQGVGAGVALYPEGEWITPLGPIQINSRLNSFLKQHVPLLQEDAVAHNSEHSLEVLIPFIQYLRPDATISAICLGHGDFDAVRSIGEGITAALRAYGREVLIIASSDMTHYESADSARRKDGHAVDKMLNLNPEGLLQVCKNDRITMCGVIPAAVMLVAARGLGASHAELVAYGTSGDVTGDERQVVGYASLAVW
jgi:AmmeMemoRadiSam system protein B